MDALQTFGSAMGLGLLAGVRLYATVFALGLAMRLGWFELGTQFHELAVVSETPVLIASGLACLLEFLADKIPFVDSVWDSVHTFIRPIGAALLGAAALGSFDPTARFLLALLCGGVALSGHSSKAATRLVVNSSPEPFSNFGLSIAEDMFVPAGLWLAMQHPLIALGFVGVFVLFFAWLSPKVFRLLKLSTTALRGLVRSWLAGNDEAGAQVPAHPALSDGIRVMLASRALKPLPPPLAGRAGVAEGIAAAVRTGPLANSTGYLCVLPDRFEFVTRRWFRARVEVVLLAELQNVHFRSGPFLDRMTLKTARREHRFDLFKTSPAVAPTAFAAQPSRAR